MLPWCAYNILYQHLRVVLHQKNRACGSFLCQHSQKWLAIPKVNGSNCTVPPSSVHSRVRLGGISVLTVAFVHGFRKKRSTFMEVIFTPPPSKKKSSKNEIKTWCMPLGCSLGIWNNPAIHGSWTRWWNRKIYARLTAMIYTFIHQSSEPSAPLHCHPMNDKHWHCLSCLVWHMCSNNSTICSKSESLSLL